MKLLHIDSNILGQGSVSRTLSAEVVAALRAGHPGIEVTYRDLSADPLAHLTSAHIGALQGAAVDPALEQDIAAGQSALDEFLAADIVVIGAPMYNFGIPSQLKAWIDRLAVAGKTFRYTGAGPQGLCGGKKVIVASSRGGVFQRRYADGRLRLPGDLSARHVRLPRDHGPHLRSRRGRGDRTGSARQSHRIREGRGLQARSLTRQEPVT